LGRQADTGTKHESARLSPFVQRIHPPVYGPGNKFVTQAVLHGADNRVEANEVTQGFEIRKRLAVPFVEGLDPRGFFIPTLGKVLAFIYFANAR
jgi:hypothetical protein